MNLVNKQFFFITRLLLLCLCLNFFGDLFKCDLILKLLFIKTLDLHWQASVASVWA